MSFNSNHITLENYELFFLLYVDRELDEAGRAEVEAFVLAYPHLQPELDVLLGTRLPLEAVSFHKESLMAGHMKEQLVEEDLLLYIDDELPADRHRQVQLELALNPSYRTEYDRLLRAKLDGSEIIAYPHKKELYRKEERRLPLVYWMRIAAAVLIVASAGVLYWNSEEVSPVSGNEVAGSKPVASQGTPALITIPPVPATEEKSLAQDMAVSGTEVRKQAARAVPARKSDAAVYASSGHLPVSSDPIEVGDATEASYASRSERGALEPLAPEQQDAAINSAPAVTSALAVRTTTIKTVETPAVTEVEPEAKRVSLKTFFRKATRMIAKTTGLEKASEGENEVLIGTMAVQLK